MRNAMPYPASPAPRQPRNTSTGNNTARSSNSSTYSRPRNSDQTDGMDTNRMFELFENKAEVEILNSPAEDRLAASMYGGIKKKKKKVKKPKKGVSGYDFDALIKDESSSSSTSDYQ